MGSVFSKYTKIMTKIMVYFIPGTDSPGVSRRECFGAMEMSTFNESLYSKTRAGNGIRFSMISIICVLLIVLYCMNCTVFLLSPRLCDNANQKSHTRSCRLRRKMFDRFLLLCKVRYIINTTYSYGKRKKMVVWLTLGSGVIVWGWGGLRWLRVCLKYLPLWTALLLFDKRRPPALV